MMQSALPAFLRSFGGGIEQGETSEQALRREIREELNLDVVGSHFFGTFESAKSLLHVFTLRVNPDFERHIRVLEGEYGEFLSKAQVDNLEKISAWDRGILEKFFAEQNS